MAELDSICKRYGCLPSDLLHLDLDEYWFNLRIALAGAKSEEKEIKKAQKQMKQRSSGRRR